VGKRWCSLDGLKVLTRTEILDANEWLDALEEAGEIAQEKAETESKKRK
jgi:hypothetical protein